MFIVYVVCTVEIKREGGREAAAAAVSSRLTCINMSDMYCCLT